MSIKINKIQLENVKRVKAVKVEPTPNGLTVIGGRNGQGKTSVLDSIAWALGGERFRPSQPQREGSTIPPYLKVVLSNGLVVERKGKNSSLTVTDPSGQRAGQRLLDSFVEQLAIDLPRFLHASNKEKADTLLKIIGVGDQLAELERKERELYDTRRAIGQIADQKAKFAKEMPYYPDAPKELLSAADLIKQQQEILARNGENQRKRERAAQLEHETAYQQQIVDDLRRKLAEAEAKLADLEADLEIARKTAQQLVDESTEELERSIAEIEEINRKVRANLDKDKAEEDAQHYFDQYNELTTQIEQVRQAKVDLLKGAPLPYPGLSVEDGELTYNGQRWDNMAHSEQLKVATAIVRALNPKCGFVLLDGLEAMDLDTLREFGAWLEAEGLQAIATRVSNGDECTLIIEDGYVVGQEYETDEPAPAGDVNELSWKAGEF